MAHLTAAITLLLTSAHASATSHYTPDRISYSALKSNGDEGVVDAFLDPLTRDGLISVTDIPGFRTLKKDTLTWLHACLMDQRDADAAHHVYADGTIRRTFAGVTVPGPFDAGVPQSLQVTPKGDRPLTSVSSHACDEFSKNLDAFRAAVDSTTSIFAKRLSNGFGSSLESPIMNTEDGSHSFDTIESLVKEGNHLEHFHSYQKSESTKKSNEETIDLHTDQGFFIAFTPGMIVHHLKEGETGTLVPDLSTPNELSGGFYIETADGVIAQTQFEEQDELVFMLGDGVNQYVNTKLIPSVSQKQLRATPHSVSLSSFGNDSARVWYGRMVLPPVRGFSEEHQMTYGEIRSNLRKPSSEVGVGSSLGCSSIEAFARQLEGGDDHECDAGSIYCWHRCMAPQGFTKEDCDNDNLDMKCVNPRGQLSPGGHGDYFLKCTNTTQEETNPPQLPLRDEDTCTTAAFKSFTNAPEYDFKADLTTCETSAHFIWSVVDDKTIKGRLIFNGKFGWLAFGFPGPNATTASKKGMHEANIFMAVPGGNYDASTIGFDLSVDPSVKEYTIAPKSVGTAHRHWTDSATELNAMNKVSINTNDCFTSLDFEVVCIKDTTFNVTGTDILLWAGNALDTYGGYHGRNRAQFSVEWKTGEYNFTHACEHEEECEEDSHDSHDNGGHHHGEGCHDSDSSSMLSTWTSSFLTVTSIVGAFMFMD